LINCDFLFAVRRVCTGRFELAEIQHAAMGNCAGEMEKDGSVQSGRPSGWNQKNQRLQAVC